jgi:aminoglycoside phosphotransferase (APT) family kinase protein
MVSVTETTTSDLEDFLIRNGLARPGEPQRWSVLSGGVSSDIWRVELPGRSICVKRALPKLRVQADWQAPPDRNLYEWRWFNAVRRWAPDAAPEPLAFDPDRRLLAMAFLEPEDHPLWKAELLAGRVEPAFAAAVGERLGAIHSASAREPALAAEFASDEGFFALRIDAYLLATARNRPEVAGEIEAIAARTADTHLALVHGDVSPKNILMGPKGPVFLDAETAWWGDPAFDLAFCLNHLLLKRLAVPHRGEELNESFRALTGAYLERVDWEPRAGLEARAASLLPALFLARVDGKSPVEYITFEDQCDLVRSTAIELLRRPPAALDDVRAAWDRKLER